MEENQWNCISPFTILGPQRSSEPLFRVTCAQVRDFSRLLSSFLTPSVRFTLRAVRVVFLCVKKVGCMIVHTSCVKADEDMLLCMYLLLSVLFGTIVGCTIVLRNRHGGIDILHGTGAGAFWQTHEIVMVQVRLHLEDGNKETLEKTNIAVQYIF